MDLYLSLISIVLLSLCSEEGTNTRLEITDKRQGTFTCIVGFQAKIIASFIWASIDSTLTLLIGKLQSTKTPHKKPWSIKINLCAKTKKCYKSAYTQLICSSLTLKTFCDQKTRVADGHWIVLNTSLALEHFVSIIANLKHQGSVALHCLQIDKSNYHKLNEKLLYPLFTSAWCSS